MMWTYFEVDIYPAGRNSSGIRWCAYAGLGHTLRADTKAGMRELIRFYLKKGK